LGYHLASDAAESGVAAISESTVLSPDCGVELVYSYSLCAHEERVSAPSRKYIGMDKERFAAALPGFRVTEFSSDRAAARMIIPRYCPKHLILHLEGGELRLLRTIPRQDAEETLRTFSADLTGLSAEEALRLERGAVFSSESEAYSYISRLRESVSGGRASRGPR